MLSKLTLGLTKIKGYLIAAGAAFLAILAVYFKGSSDQKNKARVKQKETELKAHKAVSKAAKKSRKKTVENNEKANNGDWSGFNR